MPRPAVSRPALERIRGYTFIAALHVLPATAIMMGPSRRDWLALPVFYLILSLSVGVGLHRYFAHRSFKTSRLFQFLMGLGSTLTFTDPIGFAGKHRLHHKHSDDDRDVHNPDHGFWFCWFGSLIDEGYTDEEIIAHARDLSRYSDLAWLHRWRYVPGLTLAAGTWAVGGFTFFALAYVGALGLLLNLTSSVNYLCHRWGTRRYETDDKSRNNLLVAIWSFGEGWHNNHHHYPTAARAGFYWWEFDPLYWIIRALAAVRVVWDVREVPDHARRAGTAVA
jgi:stearoyl-CoA desaturase (Delta-9 desaturase)